jgi:choline dehydrogenase-like flavoprotein
MTSTIELTDVVVIGSGYGGAIPAYHLAAGGAKVVILERGLSLSSADFAHDMRLGSYTRYVDIIVGDGISVAAGNCVGGGSVVNFAASLRAPSFIFNRMGSMGVRQWPSTITRATLDPWYDVVEETLPVSRQTWNDVTYAGGVFAAACDKAGRSCNMVPLAVDMTKCTNCGWQLNGCHFDAKRSMLLNYLPAAVAHGADVRAQHEVQVINPATTSGYRYQVAYNITGTDGSVVDTGLIEARVVILAAGALGTPVILQRSATTLGTMPFAVGKFFSSNGDHLSSYVVDESKVSSYLGLQRNATTAYQGSYIGKSVSTMSFDGLNAAAPEFTRFGLQQLYFAPLSAVLAQATVGAPAWFGTDKKQMRKNWQSWVTVLAMTEDDNEGGFGPPPPQGTYSRITAGLVQNSLQFHPTANTIRGYTAADTELATIMTRNGLATEVHDWTFDVLGVVTTHPLASVRIGDDPNLSALTPRNELRGFPGLFVTDGSAVPTSLCVNPSLTIAALAERAVPGIVARARSYGVPVTYAVVAPSGSTSVRSAVAHLPEVQQAMASV